MELTERLREPHSDIRQGCPAGRVGPRQLNSKQRIALARLVDPANREAATGGTEVCPDDAADRIETQTTEIDSPERTVDHLLQPIV